MNHYTHHVNEVNPVDNPGKPSYVHDSQTLITNIEDENRTWLFSTKSTCSSVAEHFEYGCQRGGIYYANLGDGIGSEQRGIRPVVIIQNNMGNKFSPTVIIAPITSKTKGRSCFPTHYKLNEICGLSCSSTILFEQIRTIDKKRLLSYVGQLTVEQLNGLEEALKTSVGVA